ncbi:MAG: right-handed parallel beta-helix repeat-containing protein [Candidatus Hodarchaeales archaeon]|jgi:parallel beta-helix repeat protein
MKKSLVLLLIISTVVLIQINNQFVRTYAADDLDNNKGEYSRVKQATQEITYTDHPNGSVYISSNADFSKYYFDLELDTYLLSNFSILNSTIETIYIENTNASFVISSCLLDSEDWNHDVISLTNVTNGRIENCTIKNGISGIKLDSCTNITIDNNTIINNSELGIGHLNSQYNNITNNDISINGFNHSNPVGIGASIQGVSKVQQTGGQGVYLDPSKFVIVSGNSIHHNKHDGIHVVDSHNITINDNCINNNGLSVYSGSPTIQGPISYKIQQTGGQGVYLDPSHNITINQNVIMQNSEYGVWIDEGTNNTITFNDFIDNNGENSQANDNNTDTTYNNSFSNNYWSDYTGNGTDPYDIDGSANNTDNSPRTSILTKTCPTTTAGSTAGFSFNIIMLVLLTITLIVRKNPRFRRKE